MRIYHYQIKGWVVSIIIHAFLLFLLSFFSFFVIVPQPEVLTVQPVELVLIEPKIIKKQVLSKKLVTKVPAKNVIKKDVPTSLPGDRKQPLVTKKMMPVYPKIALNNEWEGRVVLKIVILSNGQVGSIKIKESSGYSSLDQAFVRTVKNNYQFKSKRVLGENVKSTLTLSHVFSLGEEN